MSTLEKSSEYFSKVRAKLGLSQEDFAKRIGVSRNYVSMIEGGREPSESLKRLVKMLDEQPAASPRDQLRIHRVAAGMSFSDLSKATGYEIGVLQAVEQGNARVSEKMANALAKALPALDRETLMSGSDHPPILSDGPSNYGTVGQTPDIAVPDGFEARYVPLISWAQAGTMKAFSDEAYQYDGHMAFNVKDRRAIAVQVRGDSMSPVYGEGDVVILYPSFEARNGDTVIAKLNEERGGDVMFKLFSMSRGGTVVLSSYNPAYPPLEYDRGDFAWIYPAASVVKNLRR